MESVACEREADNICEREADNVTPKTLAWYEDAFKAFEGALESESSLKTADRRFALPWRIASLREFLATLHQRLPQVEAGRIQSFRSWLMASFRLQLNLLGLNRRARSGLLRK
jgi:hypothetical protein